jgi:cyclophilin family peptidyl-prolyl cis-trans isomerase
MRSSKLSHATSIETLEFRRLLSATLLSQIPGQNLTAGAGAAVPITLSTFFNDPSITAGDTLVNIQTNLPAPNNDIVLMLTDSATPATVANFLQYVNSGEYNGTIIHRSIPGFVIQGGGDETDGTQISTFGTIAGESSTATLKNTTGTIAMALSTGPDSATSEWFINLADNSNLDDTSDGGPFTAFGSVVYGMNTVNAIAALQVVDASGISGEWSNLPLQSVPSGPPIPDNDFVIINPAVTTAVLSYNVVSSNPSVVAAAVTNGSLTLTPGSTGGTSNITVTATDLGGGTAVSNFTVTVAGTTPPPSTPVANADSATTTINKPVIVNVLANDTGNLNAATVAVITAPTGGTAAVNSDGTITYTPTNGFTGSDSFSYTVANTDGVATSPATVSIDVTLPPGLAATVGTGAAKAITYTDANGTIGTITLRGPGTATLFFQGTDTAQTTGKTGITITGTGESISGIDTTGTGNASVLTITTKGGTKQISVGDVSTQSLKSIVATGVTFTGDINATGLIQTLSIAGASGGTITTTGISTLTDSGIFSDDIISSVPGSQSIGNFTAASVPTGTWTLTGTVRNINVTKGDLDAKITAASVSAMHVKGNLSAAALNLTAVGNDLNTLAVNGTITGSTITAAGNIGAITAASLTNSQIYAGVGNFTTGQLLPSSAADFVTPSTIRAVTLRTVKGSDSFSNSDIAASLLTNLSLGTIQTDNGGNPTGVAAETITTLTATAGKKFTLHKLTSASDLSALLTKAGAVITPDFQIDLIAD